MVCKKCKESKEEIKMLNNLIDIAQPEDWDQQCIYDDIVEGTFNGNNIYDIKPDLEFGKWFARRFKVEEIDYDEE